MTKRERKKQKKRKRFIINLLLISSLILILSLLYIDILPLRYLGYIAVAIAIIDFIMILIIKVIKKKQIPSVIAFLLSIIMLLGSFYTLKTDGLLNNLNLNYKTYNYSVVVLKSNNYKKIEDRIIKIKDDKEDINLILKDDLITKRIKVPDTISNIDNYFFTRVLLNSFIYEKKKYI